MFSIFLSTAITLCIASAVQGHMRLYYPPPFAAENNPRRTGPADQELDYPYNCCGKQTPFPCKGYLNLLGTSEGDPVAAWEAGSVQNFSLTGTGNHYGGSCQVGFSIDKGVTWKVVRSYEGNCPHRYGGVDPSKQTFEFTVPADMPAGDHVFAWTWVNREQEFNMLCSSVTITNGTRKAMLISSTSKATQTTQTSGSQPSHSDYVDSDGCSFECPKRLEKRQYLPHHPHASNGLNAKHIKRKVASPPTVSSESPSLIPSGDPSTPFHDRPSFFVTDIGNGCTSPKTNFELKYPNPGPDVLQGDGEYKLKLPSPANKCGI